jgi:hypothetical protein
MKAITKNLFLSLLIFPLWVIKGTAQMVGTPYPPPYMPNVCMAPSTQGKEFWVSFGPNFDITDYLLALNIATGDSSTKVELTFMAGNDLAAPNTVLAGSTAIYSIGSNSVKYIDLSAVQNTTSGTGSAVFNTAKNMKPAVYLPTAEGQGSRTLYIKADQPVSVYAFNTGFTTTDATILLPIDTWGNEYFRLSYRINIPAFPGGGGEPPHPTNYDYEMIIANENDTEIKLVTGGTSTTLATLQRGEVYYNAAASDRTGRHITSTKPVAYFTHNTITYLPNNKVWADILLEQLAPVDHWGKKFLVPNAFENSYTSSGIETNIIRVVASAANTTVKFPGATRFNTDGNSGVTGTGTTCTLASPGSWVALQISGNVQDNPSCYIEADKPVGVAAYMTGGAGNTTTQRALSVNGDPSIAWIPALNQSIAKVEITPFMFPYNNPETYTVLERPTSIHYMIIIAPKGKEIFTKVNSSSNGSNNAFYYMNANNTFITGSPLPATAKMNGGALNDPNSWKTNDDAGYSYYVWRFTNPESGADHDYLKTFKVENPYGVIVLGGGVSIQESYYYNAGSGACELNQ